MNTVHQPVLLAEVIERMRILPNGTYVDATVGGGGHAEAILSRLSPEGRLLGLDRDEAAIERTSRRLRRYGNCVLAASPLSRLKEAVAEAGIARADGILMDLGMSSDQLADGERGFSFQREGPLDMRMDRSGGTSAADLVNGMNYGALADTLRRLGEERAAGRIARAIVAAREKAPITTTRRLAEVIEKAVPRRGRLHPATRTFQALRIAVNDELGELEKGLASAFELLAEEGRLLVISFHSLEDRIVKRSMSAHVGRDESLQQGGSVWRGQLPRMRWLTRKPVTPSAAECAENPRSRSAKLRAVERIRHE